jgi:hypothetical protein
MDGEMTSEADGVGRRLPEMGNAAVNGDPRFLIERSVPEKSA